jgi:hypothetical protein
MRDFLIPPDVSIAGIELATVTKRFLTPGGTAFTWHI